MYKDFFGEGAKFHHIGLAVNSIDENADKIYDKIQNVNVSFFDLHGLNIELIEPVNSLSPITERLKKGNKLVHICFVVKDINNAIIECKKYNFICIAKPVPAIAFNNKLIAWVFNKNYGLFELLEE